MEFTAATLGIMWLLFFPILGCKAHEGAGGGGPSNFAPSWMTGFQRGPETGGTLYGVPSPSPPSHIGPQPSDPQPSTTPHPSDPQPCTTPHPTDPQPSTTPHPSDPQPSTTPHPSDPTGPHPSGPDASQPSTTPAASQPPAKIVKALHKDEM
ncbi:hypothetical protein DCAR_0831240 [Daucus carota subsp. sativus]|uniref:Uncharacterized protein n=1 Tax=Daucus carota subsp. sativus TaxID=79200 RepID=A0A175YL24_DAUCS|nr:PREDICTED: soluble scavenger receptor cysteine-rich domain-containing protein SSC5D-like [Daucus carota subsp. sativus]WOH11749.1 hypothetical protein DCAR_0831240 [Daucus carota subsp. sativus]